MEDPSQVPVERNEPRRGRRSPLWGCWLIAAVPSISLLGLAGYVVREIARNRAHLDNYEWQQRMGGRCDPIRTQRGSIFTNASFDCTEMDDTELAELVRRMPDLEDLHLCGTLITDESLPVIGRLRSLKELDVGGTNVTPAAVAEFRRTHPAIQVRARDGMGSGTPEQWASASLQRAADLGGAFNTSAREHPMSLAGCRVTSDDLHLILSQTPNLGRISLRNTSASNDSLRHLQVFCQSPQPFPVVNLAGTAIGDAGLSELGVCLDHIQVLILRGTPITDAGLNTLGATHLIHLDLRDTQVTDAGLARISTQNAFTTLRLLRLTGSQATPAGVRKLRSALPKAEIEF